MHRVLLKKHIIKKMYRYFTYKNILKEQQKEIFILLLSKSYMSFKYDHY